MWNKAVGFERSREVALQESRDRLARPSWLAVVAISRKSQGSGIRWKGS